MQASLDLQIPEGYDGGTRLLRIVVTESDLGVGHDDEYVAGDYSAEVPSRLTDGQAAECALESFFISFVVNWPDSFSYEVFDFHTGERLEPDQSATGWS